MRFGVEVGLLTRAEAKGTSEAELHRLHQLRALLQRVFTERPPATDDLDSLSRLAAAALRHARLRPSRNRKIERAFDARHSGDALLRHRIVTAAVELLTSDLVERIKSCPSCGWVFLDVSKNRSRRWCSMEMCGGAAKARAYYRRKHG